MAKVREVLLACASEPFTMRPERWKLVEQILEAALEKAPDARSAYIAQACRGDEDLRREVETLIKAYDQAGSFIEAPLLAGVSTAPPQSVTPSVEAALPPIVA